MKTLLKAVAWLFKFTLALILILVAVSAVIIALEIKVELDPLRQPVALAASKALDREVELNGSVSLVPTLWPTLEIQDVNIGNPEDWPGGGDLAQLGLLRLQLGIAPLLSGKIQVADATATGVTLKLATDAKGQPNWQFGDPKEDKAADEDDGDGPSVRFESLDNLTLKDIDLHYADGKLGKKAHFALTEMQGQIVDGQPFSLQFSGSFQNKPYQFEFEGGSLDDLRGREVNWPVKLEGTIVDTPVTLNGEIDREAEPTLKAQLKVGKVDAGAVLAFLKVVDGMKMTVGGLNANLTLRGKDPSELLENAQMELVLNKAQINVPSRDKKSSLPLIVDTGKVAINPGKPLTITLDSKVDGAPVNIRITGSTLLDYTKEGEKLPLIVELDAGGATAKLSTRVARPIDTSNLALQMSMSGKRLDDMDDLLQTDLPPLGPYSLKGGFALTPKGYEIRDLVLKVGDSELAGDFSLGAIERPYRLDIALKSKRIQINDFNTGDWSAKEDRGESEPEAAPQSKEPSAAEKKAARANKKKLRKLLSQETLKKLNADIKVDVDQVLSGKDKLGEGSLLLTLKNGKLTIDPVKIGLPGGDAKLSFLYHPQGQKGDIAVKALVDHFDYGVLARRIDAKSDISGYLSLDVDLSAHVNDPKNLLANAKGHFDFGLWPGSMDASLFDMWAVNVVTSLMSEVDGKETSKVNCVVVGFTVNQGIMKQDVVFADTSSMRVAGAATVDFRRRTIDIRAVPKAKKPQFFSLSTPVGMSGTFDKFGIHINPVELTATTVSFITSPLHVPVRSLFSKDVEVDGEKACTIAWETVNANPATGPADSKGPAPAAAKTADDKKVDVLETMNF